MALRTLAVVVLIALAGACTTTNKTPDEVKPASQPDALAEEGGEQLPAGIGEPCGTVANIPCADDAFCDYDAEQSGLDDGSGTCQQRPGECEEAEGEASVCGRDGQTYPSECHANLAGVDVVVEGADAVCPATE